jgi:hypothetical protein
VSKYIALAAASLFVASPAFASTTLTFEGIPNQTAVGSFYGPDYVFSPATLALVDADAGGGGNFANEPSPNTIMFFTDANNAILNVTNGFTTGFSFYYSSATAASVNVYDALNGTGNLLATLNLAAQYNTNCTGDPTGQYCNWTAIGVNFSGTAYSINFAGTAGYTGFDNITFGSATPGNGAVPEPGTWGMMLIGFAGIGFALRRRRHLTKLQSI